MFYRLVDLVHEMDYGSVKRLFDERRKYEIDQFSALLSGLVSEGMVLVKSGKMYRERVSADVGTRSFVIADSDGVSGEMVTVTRHGICDVRVVGLSVSVGDVLRFSDAYPSSFEVDTDLSDLDVADTVVYSLASVENGSETEPYLIPALVVPDDFVRIFSYHYEKVHSDVQNRLGNVYKLPYQVGGVAIEELPDEMMEIYSAMVMKRLYSRRRYYVDMPMTVDRLIQRGMERFDMVMNGTITLPIDRVAPYRDVPKVTTDDGVFTKEFFSRRRF